MPDFRHLQKELQSLPSDPGIYLFLDSDRKPLYIGKAKVLKNRVRSYFVKQDHPPRIKVMVSQIQSLETIITSSEEEALLLEAQYIKSHQPRYNVLLKDDKSFPYVKITTSEPFPRVLVVRQKRSDKDEYFGPFPSMGSTRAFQRLFTDLFPIRDCSQPITLSEKQPKCILLDIGKCLGPCIYKNVRAEYDRLIDEIRWVLLGRNKELRRKLHQEMMDLSAQRKFEDAAKIRDRFQRIQQCYQKQTIIMDNTFFAQIWVLVQDKQFIYILFQDIREGVLMAQKGWYHPKTNDASDQEFIEEIYHREVFWNHDLSGVFFLTHSHWLDHIKVIDSESPIDWAIPQKGDKHHIVQRAIRNAHVSLNRLKKPEHQSEAITHDHLVQLQKELSLMHVPERIIGFDISHLGGTDIVASAVQFFQGESQPSFYRKFNIRTVTDQSNDPLSMTEVVTRRLNQCIEKNDPLPHCILIDGGKPQLNFAIHALKALQLDHRIDIISLAKREEEIYSSASKTPIQLGRRSRSRRYLEKIRDEAHRFAVQHQRTKRKHKVSHSSFRHIRGVGPKTEAAIWSTFKTKPELLKASLEDLQQKLSISRLIALRIYEFLHPK